MAVMFPSARRGATLQPHGLGAGRRGAAGDGRRRLPPHISRVLETEKLQEFIDRHQRLFVLTGAGCSTNSGIPDYRDADGNWKRAQPVTFQAFMGGPATRQRYWARSLLGWRTFGRARPNRAHDALARLEAEARASFCSRRTWTACTRRPAAPA